ncbi:MAG: UvrD-helicase domain-containing protein [Aquificae bacterium]|nr:UvrD-helicase domain-containing protein [Aquificota bacterium]
MSVLENLNEKQKEAVLHTQTPLLVLAGAGSGKTRVITHKITYLINEKHIPLDKILAITFTNKAAQEMKQRIKKTLSLEKEPQWISTFHSLCVKILRQEAQNIGLDKNFVIYDEEDSKKTLKDILKELNLDLETYKPEKTKSIISSIKQDMDESILEFYEFTMPHIRQIYQKYQDTLKQNNAVDFDDLLLLTVELFLKNREILHKWQSKFDYILVDEYQDTNKIQHKLLKLLTGDRTCITVVGDPQQCIYTWRGANPNNILEFEKDFPNTKIIKLEKNYRSTTQILQTANKIISNSKGKWKEKVLKLWTENKEGEKVKLAVLSTDKKESEFIARKIKDYKSQGYLYSDMTVLIRMSFLTRNIEEALLRADIPYQIIGGVKFYERAEIKDILAYLKISLNPKDTQAFKRIINLPPRGIGQKTIDKIKQYYKTDWIQAVYDAYDEFSNKVKLGLQSFLELVQYVQKYANQQPAQTAKYIYDAIDYENYLQNKYTNDWEDRVANIKELFNALQEVEKSGKTLTQFLEESSLSQAQDNLENTNTVKIMTIHASKGLEFPIVFIAGLEEGIFPSGRAFEDIEQMEEERRLFYVAVTRAKEKVYLTYAKQRSSFGNRFQETKQSRFIKEIKEELEILGKKRPPKTQKKVISDELRIGQLVSHELFGKGVIKSINDNRVTVIFEKEGEKTLKKGFLKGL